MEKNNYEEMLAQRKAKAEAQAKEYFYNQKQREAYYWAEGGMLNDFDSHNEAFIHFTDEEIEHIKTLIIKDVNDCQITPQPVTSVKEALEVLDYGDLFEENVELRKLLLERCEKADLYPDNVDFDTRYYFYKFSCVPFDYTQNKVLDPIPVEILLTDGEYLTLLSLQLQDRENFTFNQLLITHPELAQKVNSKVEGEIYGWRFPIHVPFAILFDEIRRDAETIDGLLSAGES